jgi:hypothetical protein
LADLVAYAGIVIAIAAVIPLYIDLVGRYRNRARIEFELEKFYEANNDYFASLYGLRVLHPNKVIDHCQVFLDSQPLPWWDSPKSSLIYDHKFPIGGGGNVRVPEAARRDDAVVIVRDGQKTLRKARFGEIPTTR